MRLALLVSYPSQVSGAQDTAELRRSAKEILSSRKYRDIQVKTPLNGPLSMIGDGVRSVFRRIGVVIDRVVPDVSGGSTLALIVVAIGFSALLARYLIVRAGRRSLRARINNDTHQSDSHWDRLADDAYAKGDYRSAIVFRFRAGITRLEKGPQPAASRQTNRVLAISAPDSFPPLGATFDGVRYGSDPGSVIDADRSKQQWPTVVQEARRHVAATQAAKKNAAKQTRRGRRR